MMYTYEIAIRLGTDIGHIAANALRDGIEHFASGAVEQGEVLAVELVSGSELKLHLASVNEIGFMEAKIFRNAVADAIRSGLDNGETADVGEMLMTAYPGSGFRH